MTDRSAKSLNPNLRGAEDRRKLLGLKVLQPDDQAPVPPLDLQRVRRAALHMLELAAAFERRGSVDRSDGRAPEPSASAMGTASEDEGAYVCLEDAVVAMEDHLAYQHLLVRRDWLRRAVDVLGERYGELVSHAGPEELRFEPNGADRIRASLAARGFSPSNADMEKSVPHARFISKPRPGRVWEGPRDAAADVVGKFAKLRKREVYDEIRDAAPPDLLRLQWAQHVTVADVRAFVEELIAWSTEGITYTNGAPSLCALDPRNASLLDSSDFLARCEIVAYVRAELLAQLLGAPAPSLDEFQIIRDDGPPPLLLGERAAEYRELSKKLAGTDPTWRAYVENMIDSFLAEHFPAADGGQNLQDK